MHKIALKKILIGLLFLWLIASPAFALSDVPLIFHFDHEWSVQTSGGTYGIEGDGSTTFVCWGQHAAYFAVPFYGVVSVGALALCGGCFLGLHFTGRRSSNEKEAA